MDIKKAVLTAAGKSQRGLPLQTLVDRDGQTKTALRILIEEVLLAGIEELCLIISPGDQAAYAEAAGSHSKRIHFVEQPEAQGYGHAVYCAREFTANAPFLLLVSDHLYVSKNENRCACEFWSRSRSAWQGSCLRKQLSLFSLCESRREHRCAIFPTWA